MNRTSKMGGSRSRKMLFRKTVSCQEMFIKKNKL